MATFLDSINKAFKGKLDRLYNHDLVIEDNKIQNRIDDIDGQIKRLRKRRSNLLDKQSSLHDSIADLIDDEIPNWRDIISGRN